MSTGYMGATSICREFVETKKAGDCIDSSILCSVCTLILSNECDTVLVVNSTNSTLQCMKCYSKTSGIGNAHLPSHSQQRSNPATPSAPRARNTSDVNEFGCAADAANAVASFASFMNQQEQPTLATYAAPALTLQASPAMLTCDGIYYHHSSSSS